jgi:hypothetical protein
MTIQELIIILQNRVLALNEARKHAANSGDPERVVQIDNDLITTNISLDQMKKISLNT